MNVHYTYGFYYKLSMDRSQKETKILSMTLVMRVLNTLKLHREKIFIQKYYEHYIK